MFLWTIRASGGQQAVAQATHVAFATQPSGALLNTAFAIQPVVEIRRVDNSVDTSRTDTVTISVPSPFPGMLGGTVSVSAIAGIATFTNIQLNHISPHRLAASCSGLSGATSAKFNVLFDPATVSGLRGVDAAHVPGAVDNTRLSSVPEYLQGFSGAKTSGGAGPIFHASDSDFGGAPSLEFDATSGGIVFASDNISTVAFTAVFCVKPASPAHDARIWTKYAAGEGANLARHSSDDTKYGGGAHTSFVFATVGNSAPFICCVKRTAGGINRVHAPGWSLRVEDNTAGTTATGALPTTIGAAVDGSLPFLGKIALGYWANADLGSAVLDQLMGRMQYLTGVNSYTVNGPNRYVPTTNEWLTTAPAATPHMRILASPDGVTYGEVPLVPYAPPSTGYFVGGAFLYRGVWYNVHSEACQYGTTALTGIQSTIKTFTIATSINGVDFGSGLGQINVDRGDSAGVLMVFRAQHIWNSTLGVPSVLFDASKTDLSGFHQYEIHPLSSDPSTWGDSSQWSSPVQIVFNGAGAENREDVYPYVHNGNYFIFIFRTGKNYGAELWKADASGLGLAALRGSYTLMQAASDSASWLGLPAPQYEGENPLILPSGQFAVTVDRIVVNDGGTGIVKLSTGDPFNGDVCTWTSLVETYVDTQGNSLQQYGTGVPFCCHQGPIFDRVWMDPSA